MILFADADGASKFSDFDKLETALGKDLSVPTVAIGSRAHMVDTPVVVQVRRHIAVLDDQADKIKNVSKEVVHQELSNAGIPYGFNGPWNRINQRHPVRLQVFY